MTPRILASALALLLAGTLAIVAALISGLRVTQPRAG